MAGDKAQLIKQNEQLRIHANLQRVPVSQSAADMKAYIDSHIQSDPLVNPVDKKDNPWADKSKCTLL
ncbi:Guanine nucleotide-binding protein subunit gamma-e [Trichoplax sp. H2]|uniref:Guanine nucleotide-binding protein subunit gamma n=1 Tax=Trichoplax adhaerens TaxID=10228 RepID=B3RMM7_TRIAD|nr:expressed hypothetical protein [Trichoplax adhaerens]AZJ50981.1 G protein gamma subunit 1 [Trichoplax adhaerens]EDV27301.1 expressed hypothetical protein [Trichoplax adhaerens]RDD44014.1 Guanine nucleotide-binding protein subunit gamma-e [Trichoplax sp. H2]|eukprot:XP_002109135.1 expressed hypothetical protein [Trichoplax adhaerens]